MMHKKQYTALFLAVLMLASSAAVSCGSEKEQTAASTAAPTETAAPETLSPEQQNEASLTNVIKSLPQKDYAEHEFNILDRSEDYSSVWYTYDVFAEAENSDPINDAVFRRNRILEETFNIKITETRVTAPTSDIKKSITSGDDAHDVFTDGLNAMSSLTTGGFLYNIFDIEEINLSEPWWDPMMTKELSVADKIFFATGDISIMDNEGTWCILFNKKMIDDFDFEDPYAMVRNGTWTLDKMHTMAKEVAKDLNGDGKMTGPDDQFGFLTEDFNVFALWSGAGNMIITKNSDDLPEISFFSERSSSVYDKVLEFQTDTCTALPDGKFFKDYGEMDACFTSGRGLFQYGAMGLITDFRESALDFGVLPSPKYDEAQENYANTFSCYNMTAYGIPATASDISRTGTILEAMAELSRYTLTPAYLDVSLKGKFTRDEESAETIDLILNTRSYDLGAIFQWGGIFSIFQGGSSKKIGTLSSQYEKKRKTLEKAINSYVDKVMASDT